MHKILPKVNRLKVVEFQGLFNPIPPTVFCGCLGISGRGQPVPEIFLKRKLRQVVYDQYQKLLFLLFSKQQVIFKENNLEIVIECNKEIANYLDITLNLNDGTFKPYYKTTLSSNTRNQTILQEQNRIDFQELTYQQADARKTRHKRLTSEKDVIRYIM